jgi:xylose isomerase
MDLAELAKLAETAEPKRISGKTELIENMINQYLVTT